MMPAFRNPKDGSYYFSPAEFDHSHVLEALEAKYPELAPFKKWEKGYVDSIKLGFVNDRLISRKVK